MIWFLKKIFWYGSKRLSQSKNKQLSEKLAKISKHKGKQKFLELDILYHWILRELWYTGSFGEILKQNPKEIKNLDEIWELHKLRNTLAHELRDIDERFISKQSRKYENTIKKFLGQITR